MMYFVNRSPCSPIGTVTAAASGCFHLDTPKARIAYHRQKRAAALRGIEWRFTFETWLKWWGEDLDRRGVRRGQLCMQRFADTGPYSPENTKKGTPQDNANTRKAMYEPKRWARIAKEWASYREVSADDETPDDRPTPSELGYFTSHQWWEGGREPK